ncbi:pimeloyl-ACP methyl ester esterase BioH [Sulfuriferula nivalis]|uniref:Pimeloyl-[acyl-carrier protein] methyl ester esterase n=1 Tax=Sulfuriferula nivalis TaxID=2675298 RepID=A0A809SIK5_9PROT|nr:pimeloyl-ACP methyl ester esterase BioH [Sulfuriferula nivalis]BBP02050.1 pimeloyl-[acyl-carrier protein] methyl ester esterase [Sulfuriferula nivalis]
MTPLVMLHGWGMHSGVWTATAEVLGERAQLVDMPGYGGRAAVAPYTLENLAEAIAAELPPLFDLCGWSLGGQVAMTLARLMPQRVRRLVLVGANPCFTTRTDWHCGIAPEVLTQFGEELAVNYEVTLKRFLALQARGDEEARAVLVRLRSLLFARGKPDSAVLQAGLTILLQADLRPQLNQITMPTLVVHGSFDQLAPVCAAEWLAPALPDGRLHVIPGASHAPFLSHRTEFETALIEFLDER